MLRFLFHVVAAFTLVAMALAGAASAEIVYYFEDFENDGQPGFDSMFNHEFSAEPGKEPNWRIGEWPEGDFFLGLAGATDTITFNLPSSAAATYGAVYLSSGNPVNSYTSVRFVGSEGWWETGPDDYGSTFVKITASQIGAIGQIQLHSSQGIFRGVIIGVIPEPGSMVLLCVSIGFAALTRVSLGRRRPRTRPF